MMKSLKVFLHILCLVGIPYELSAQFHKSVDLTPTVYRTVEDLFFDPYSLNFYPGQNYSIGHQYFSNPKEDKVWRSLYKFDLSSIPANAVIDSAKLISTVSNYDESGYGGVDYLAKANLLPDTTNPTSGGAGAFSIATAGSQVASSKYTDTGKTDMSSPVQSRLAVGRIVFGGYSSVELSNTSKAQLTLALKVWYYLPFPVTFQNDFAGGTMGVVGPGVNNASTPVPYASTSTKLGDSFTLTANAQQDGSGYDRVWNNYAPNFQSNWDKRVGQGTPEIKAFSTTYSFNAAQADSGATYTANLRKNYRISRNEQTEFDGTQSVGVVTHLVEQNSGSVPAPLQKTVNGRDYRFYGWSDGNTSNPLPISPIDNTTYTAMYKAHLGSSTWSATGFNNQRKIVFSGDRHHLLYEASGEIWYVYSTDNGATWSSEVRLSDGSGKNRTPSIADNTFTGPDRPFISAVWERFDAAAQESRILLSHRNNTTGVWEPPTLVWSGQGVSTSAYATPVIATKQYLEWVAWSISSPSAFAEPGMHVWFKDNDPYTWYPDPMHIILSGTTTASIRPSVDAYPYWGDKIGMAYQENGAIKFCEVTYDGQGGSIYISSSSVVSSGSALVDHGCPSFAYEHVSPYRAVVAWNAFDDYDTYQYEVVERRKETNGWGSFTQYLGGDDYVQPSIVPSEISQNLAMTWHNNGGSVILSTYTNGSWSPRTMLSVVGINPVIGFDSYPYGKHRIAYTAFQGMPYAVGTTNQGVGSGLPKSSGVPDDVVERCAVATQGGERSFVSFRALVKDGEVSIAVPFSRYTDSTLLASDLSAFGITDAITVPANGTLTIEVGEGATRSNFAIPSLVVSVIDDANGRPLCSLNVPSKNGVKASRKNLVLELHKFAGMRVRFGVLPVLENATNAQWAIAVLHRTSEKGKKFVVKQEAIEEITLQIPESFALLQNYPNPFNPSTVVSYQLPLTGHVSLKVFDILGREVATLVDEERAAGTYSVQFDASHLASGIYFYQLIAQGVNQTRKMLVTK